MPQKEFPEYEEEISVLELNEEISYPDEIMEFKDDDIFSQKKK